jgi:hypothetical protein
MKDLNELLKNAANNIFSVTIKKIFNNMCLNYHSYIDKWLYKIKPDIYINAFINACLNGNLHVAKRLYEIKPDINIGDCYDYAFRYACVNGHIHVAQWL